MRQLILVILILLSLNSKGQATIHNKIQFKVIKYNDGTLSSQTPITIDTDLAKSKLDLYFFKKHFDVPHYLPDQFINSKHKSEVIAVWANEKEDKNLQTNWNMKYTYDSLSRVVNYTYSSCFACDDMPYRYNVTYNGRGLAETIEGGSNIGIEKTYKIYYDGKGNIKEIDYYLFDKLEEQIIRE